MKRIVAFIFIISVLLTVFSGCNNSNNNIEETSDAEETSAVVDASTSENENKQESPAEDFYYTEKDDGTLLIGYKGKESDVVVPAEIDKKIVTEIIWKGFHYNKDNLRSVTLPETITIIGTEAFEDCSLLAEINLPDSLTSVGIKAFLGCTSLKQITIPANCIFGDAALAQSGVETVIFKEGVETISNALVETKVKEVVLPNSVREIGFSAFDRCYDLEKVTLNEGLVTIKSYAFSKTKIKEIIIPKSVKSIDETSFSGCKDLEKVIFEGDAPQDFMNELLYQPSDTNFTVYYKSTATGFTTPVWNGYKCKAIGSDADNYKTLNNFECFQNTDGGITIIGYTGTATALTIPAQIEGKNVTKIETSAFNYNKILVEVTFPDTLKIIGARAFQHCEALKTINLSENLDSIEFFAFYYCANLETVTLPGNLTKLGRQAFSYCLH